MLKIGECDRLDGCRPDPDELEEVRSGHPAFDDDAGSIVDGMVIRGRKADYFAVIGL